MGSVESESYDQVLDSVMVGPVPKGVSQFIFDAPAPDWTKMPKNQILGVTVLFLSCLFKDKEFLRIGYYVHNEYDDPDAVYKKTTESAKENAIEIDLSENEDDQQLQENIDTNPNKKQKIEERLRYAILEDNEEAIEDLTEKLKTINTNLKDITTTTSSSLRLNPPPTQDDESDDGETTIDIDPVTP